MNIDPANATFVNVDTQRDLICEDGRLPVPGAESIRGNLARLSKVALILHADKVNTAYEHIYEHDEIVKKSENIKPEEGTFPMHCEVDAVGQEYIPETQPIYNRLIVDVLFDDKKMPYLPERSYEYYLTKSESNVFEGNPFAEEIFEHVGGPFIVYGVAGDVCVHQTATGLVERGYGVYVVEDAIASPQSPPMDEWKQLGIETVTTDDVVEAVE